MADTVSREGGTAAPAAKSATGSAWDRLPVIFAALNPVLLLVVGYMLNANIDRAKLQIEETSAKLNDLKTAAEASSILVHDRVDKVKVISDFVNDLTGPDERRRQLAIEAIFIALPDEAARLVKAVERFSDTGGSVTARDITAAKNALDGTRSRLVASMFSPIKATRVDALATIERGWADDPQLVDMLLDRAQQDVQERAAANWAKPASPQSQQQLASIYNTVEFLSLVRDVDDAKLKAKINDFLAAVAPNSDDTRRVIATIQDRFK